MADDDVQMSEAPAAGGGDAAMAEAPPGGEAAAAAPAAAAAEPEMVLPMVDESLLADVLAMGFGEVIARKALMAGASNAERAIDWILSHENDAGIGDPIPLVPKGQSLGSTAGAPPAAKSIRCVATGRLFRNAQEATVYAERTGRTDFEECTEEKKPLTAEEKKAKLAELKALAAARRAEREEVEKVEDKGREKKRREDGQKSIQTKEEMAKAARLREIDRVKREKLAEKKERERLRAEIAKDKAERRARGGKLADKLSADGYNPSIDQSDARRDAALPAGAAAGDGDEAKGEAGRVDVAKLAEGKVVSENAPPPPTLDPPAAVDKAIATLQKCGYSPRARPDRRRRAQVQDGRRRRRRAEDAGRVCAERGRQGRGRRQVPDDQPRQRGLQEARRDARRRRRAPPRGRLRQGRRRAHARALARGARRQPRPPHRDPRQARGGPRRLRRRRRLTSLSRGVHTHV